MSPKTKKRLLLSSSALLVLIGILWWSRSGSTEIDRYKAQLLAQGEILDIDKLAPIRTGNEPDGDLPLQSAVRQLSPNSLLLPVGQLLPNLQSNNLLRLEWLSHPKATNQTQRAPLWQQAETEIANRRADFQLLHTAMQNPPHEKGADYRKFTSGYPSANFVQRRSVAQLLSQVVTTDIHTRHPGEATTNMLTLLDMCEHHREEWTLVNQMIRVAITRLSLDTFQYGLDTHTWTDPELATFQSRIASISLVTNLSHSLLYERAQGIRAFAESRKSAEAMSSNLLSTASSVGDRFLMRYWANFDADEDELGYLRYTQAQLDILRHRRESHAWAGVMEEMATLPEQYRFRREGFLAYRKFLLSDALSYYLAKSISTLAFTETRRLQTITAIALERHRLKHGHYPDTLAQLIPDYLTQIPQDPMDGCPLRYRLNPDGTFTLWSAGFDGQDNGGDFSMPDPKKQNFPHDARDLIWPRLDPIDLPQ